MDSIKAEKTQAMKNYKKSQFLNNLILHTLIALAFALFCSYPFWFPHLCFSMKHFVFVSLPNLKSLFFNPKFLFILVNAIIAFVVGESKFASSCSSPATEIGTGYVESSTPNICEASTQVEKKEEGKWEMINSTEEIVNKIEDDQCMVEKEILEEKLRDDDDDEYADDGHEQEEERDEEEECGLPTEELNKRVEDFIAKVNRQRWLEARLVDYGRG